MSLISLARRGRAIALIAGALLLVPIIAEAAPGGRRPSPSLHGSTASQTPE